MSDEEEYPKKCWVVKYGRRIEEKIPDDNSVDSAVSVMVYLRHPEYHIRYHDCSKCGDCRKQLADLTTKENS